MTSYLEMMRRLVEVRDELEGLLPDVDPKVGQEVKDTITYTSYGAARLEMAAWKNGEIKDEDE